MMITFAIHFRITTSLQSLVSIPFEPEQHSQLGTFVSIEGTIDAEERNLDSGSGESGSSIVIGSAATMRRRYFVAQNHIPSKVPWAPITLCCWRASSLRGV